MSAVAMNQKDGGIQSACNAGTRRVPRRRSRARYRTDRRISAVYQSPPSLAPTLGAARTMEGPAAVAPNKSSARAMTQKVRSDSAPLHSWSFCALCPTEETGTRRQERTGWAAASRKQIRAQAGSSPGGWFLMPTELIEEGVGLAAFAEGQTRPGPGATQVLRTGTSQRTNNWVSIPGQPTGISLKTAPTPPMDERQPPWPPRSSSKRPSARSGPPGAADGSHQSDLNLNHRSTPVPQPSTRSD